MDTRSKHEEEARRLADLLSRLIRFSGRSVRSIEKQLGVGSSALGKVLKGDIRLQVGHILMIAEALSLSPAEFFQLAYPEKVPLSPLGAEMLRAMGIKGADRREIEAQVREVLREIFGELIGRPKAPAPVPDGLPDRKPPEEPPAGE